MYRQIESSWPLGNESNEKKATLIGRTNKESEKNEISLGMAQEIALGKLEREGYFFRAENNEIIFDTNRLRESPKGALFERLGPIFSRKNLGDRNVPKTITLLFTGLKVLSIEDYKTGNKEARDLIYSPMSKEDSLDINKIRQSNFYFLIDELSNIDYDKTQYGNVPMDDLDFREVALPAYLFHPNHGAGYRDEKDGRLMILDRNRKEYRPITSEYIKKNWKDFGSNTEPGNNFSYPKLFVRKKLPHLVERGILTPDDFSTRVDVRNRQMSDRFSTILNKKKFSFNGVEHVVGAKYSQNRMYQLTKDCGAIVDEKGNIVAVFNLFKQREELKSKGATEDKKYYFAGIKKTDPREFHKEDYFDQKPSESLENYRKRIKEVADFKDILDVSDKILVRENINMVDFSFKEQMLIATLFRRAGEKRFLDFIEEYQVDGLKACLSLEGGEGMEKILLKIAEQKKKDGKFSARLIFRKYNKIIHERKNLQKIIAQIVPNRDLNQDDHESVINNFEKKTRRILEEFSENMVKTSVDEIEGRLGKIQNEMIFLSLVLLLFKERKGEFSIEDIRGVEMETAGEKELRENPALVEKLTEMYRASIEHKSKVDQERLLADFEMHKKYNPKFHLVYFDRASAKALAGKQKNHPDNLVGFMRSSSFDGQKELPEGERYLGAMNIDPLLQKFYFGENFLREIVEKELSSGTKKLIAHVPEGGPSHKITQILGFKKVADEGDYKDNDGKVTAKRIRVELVRN